MTENMTQVLLRSFHDVLWWLDALEVETVTLDGEPGWRVSGWYLGHYLRFEHRYCCGIARDLRAMRDRIESRE